MSEYVPEPGKKIEPQNQPSPKEAVWSWLAPFKSSWQTTLQIDRSNITAFQAIRSTLGLALPLILGVATGQMTTFVLVASGGLMTGSVGLQDPHRKRTRTMLLCSLFVTISALVGGMVGGFGWLPVLVAISIWGIVAGMFASISQAAQIVAIQACCALIIYAHLELDPLHAALVAAAVGAGALFQTLLATIPSPWSNTVPERNALAKIYQQLADHAANASNENEQSVLLLSNALQEGHTTLLYSDTRSEQGKMFARLLEEAEHIRLTLSILMRRWRHLRLKEPDKEKASECLTLIIHANGAELQAIVRTLKSRSPLPELEASSHFEEIKRAIAELRQLALTADKQAELQQILSYCTTLLGELHIARRLAISWRHARRYWPAHIRFPYPRPPHLRLEDVRLNLRANLTPRSSAFRHATRLGVALMLATALYQVFFHTSIERGYWIPMTTALVLRSDFITTFTRGIARLVGTTLGAMLTTLLVVLIAPSPVLLVAIVVIAVYLMYTTIFANYTIFSTATTMAIAFLLAFTNAPTLTTVVNRTVDTAIGGTLALLLYAIWPTWEQTQVPENIAKRLETLGHYLNEIVQRYADPTEPQTEIFSKQHKEARLARLNAHGSVQRSLQEPAAHRVDAELANDVLAAADNVARCVLVLEAYLYDNPYHDTLPEVTPFSVSADQALSQLATAIRTRQQNITLPDLQGAFQQFKAAAKMKTQMQSETREQWHFVIEETKHIVTYIQAIRQLLSTATFA